MERILHKYASINDIFYAGNERAKSYSVGATTP